MVLPYAAYQTGLVCFRRTSNARGCRPLTIPRWWWGAVRRAGVPCSPFKVSMRKREIAYRRRAKLWRSRKHRMLALKGKHATRRWGCRHSRNI